MNISDLIPHPTSPEREGGKDNSKFDKASLLQERGWGEVKVNVSASNSEYNMFMIKIRKATPEDTTVIIDFQQKMAWETEQMTLVPEIIFKGVNSVFDDPSRGQYWVAAEDGQIVASLLITYEWSDWRNSNVWWFQSVYVLPEFRRTGIFRSMYRHIKNEAGKEGIPGLRLYVEANNTSAQQTYEALGMNGQHYRFYEWMKE